MIRSRSSRWGQWLKQGLCVFTLLLGSVYLAGKLVMFTTSEDAIPIVSSLFDAKRSLFWPLFCLRCLIYICLIWVSPGAYQQLRRSVISAADKKTIRWTVVRILVVYEFLFGLNIFQWM